MDLDRVALQPQLLNFNRPEDILGKTNLQPFCVSNSAVRSQMFSTHNSQKIQIANPEVPIISTGYENKYGELSSTFVRATSPLRVLAKIAKFRLYPNHIYFLIYQNMDTNTINVFNRVPYYYVTETYGFLMRYENLDKAIPGDVIPKDAVLSCSKGYDENYNRMDGLNLVTVYMATDRTKEDSITISESAAKKMQTDCFHNLEITINDNDDPVNLYGQNGVYKVIPDILEYTKDNIVCALKRRKKDDSLYTQAAFRMNSIGFDDDCLYGSGLLMDLNIYCNNPERLETNAYNAQLKYYYDERKRLNEEIVACVDTILSRDPSIKMEIELETMYEIAKKELAGCQFKSNDNSTFSNIRLELMVYEPKPMAVGDKMSNRYGGKGVISTILKDEDMMKTYDGKTIDVIENKNTVIGRENPGQLWEMEVNYVGHCLIEFLRMRLLDPIESIKMYIKFVQIVAPEYGNYAYSLYLESSDQLENRSGGEIQSLLDAILEDDYIDIVISPISENMHIDKLEQLYQEFPMAVPRKLICPIKNSRGETRYVYSSRPLIYAPIFYYRLKQTGEEKFSATSLSPTNLKGQNAKSKAAKLGRESCKGTPVMLSHMEVNELLHLDAELTIMMILLYSNSPQGRRRCMSLLTDDPYNVDITIDSESPNREAEILNTYFKTLGLKFEYTRYTRPTTIPFVTCGEIINPFIVEKAERLDV